MISFKKTLCIDEQATANKIYSCILIAFPQLKEADEYELMRVLDRSRTLEFITPPDGYNVDYIPLLGGCYSKSCKLKGQHTRARNHSAISRVVIAPWSRINDIHNNTK